MRCCEQTGALGARVRRPSAAGWGLRRLAAAGRWAAPVITLLLIPKCPACLAADILLLSGIGLSFSAAAAVRWGLIGLCIAALGLLVLGAARRALSARGARGSP